MYTQLPMLPRVFNKSIKKKNDVRETRRRLSHVVYYRYSVPVIPIRTAAQRLVGIRASKMRVLRGNRLKSS